ncbi:MAG TPA: hypothetical protein VJ648_12530 [Vicinamibacteria bacterium]|nr:hypothetical protein [Vicinamibacteria bacterium]
MPLASPAAEPAYRLTVVHYDLRLRLDIAEESVSGELVATARGFGAGSESLVLDVGDLAIDSVTLGRERLAFAVADHRLSVRLPRVLS